MNSYVGASNKHFWVEEQLAQYSGQTRKATGSTFIVCPWHADSDPSGRIYHSSDSKSPGFYRCYGCGKTAKWDELAVAIGLKPFKRQRPADEYMNTALLPKAIKKVVPLVVEEMVLTDLPLNKTWRGIKTSLLTSIGAKLCKINHPEHGWLKPKIYLPVIINKELRGYIKARLIKHADYPSYINASGPWSKTCGLFPFDYSIQLAKKLHISSIVLVEGPRDALRLLQSGIPAMCILGTQSWSDSKSRLLELAGITKLILMMDGDDAGRAATEMLATATDSMFEVIALHLWSIKGSPYSQFKDEEEPSKAAKLAKVSLWDPCICPQWIINKLKQKYFSRS